MLRKNKVFGRVSSFLSAISGIILLLISLLLWMNKQYVTDLIANWQYQPTPAIVALVDRTTMTDNGKFYFYASKPVLENTQAFNKECERKEASSAILGCYTGTNIFLYDVTNQDLDGIKEITAAHETLHAAYDRLGQDEKNRLKPLLEAEYKKHSDDKELRDRMAFYERNEAGELDNELHSIVGTEFSDIDPQLEKHYERYFKDRSTLVQLYAKYRTVFKELQAKTKQIEDQMKALIKQVEDESVAYNAQVNALTADIDRFNARAAAGDFTSRDAFDRERNVLVRRVTATEQARASIETKNSEYDRLRAQYEKVADASKELYNSIDSKLAPAPAI